MITITDLELKINFAKYLAQAEHEPVMITSHERDNVVLVNVDDYKRWKKTEAAISNKK